MKCESGVSGCSRRDWRKRAAPCRPVSRPDAKKTPDYAGAFLLQNR